MSPPQQTKITPIPWGQFSIMTFIAMAESVTSALIFPFAPEIIRQTGVTNGDEAKVGYYVGLLHSLFFAAQTLTVLQWSKTCDHIGRKPVILIGIFGLTLSMYCFGLSKTFMGLAMSRLVSGVLNGNIGPMKSMMVEISDSTNLARLYSFTPLSWAIGGTVGPLIGGSLARPAEQFPNLFGKSTFHKEYPFFLPCAVATAICAASWVVTYLFLKETVKNPTPVLQYFFGKNSSPTHVGYEKLETDPLQKSDPSEQPVPFRALFTPRVLIAIGSYALLSFTTVAYRTLQPLFLSTPIAMGGLGLPPHVIGKVSSLNGMLSGVAQVLLFAKLNERWGSRRAYLVGMSCFLLCFAAFPVISLAAKYYGEVSTVVWVMIWCQTAASLGLCLCHGTAFIFVSAAAPNRASLGITNGLCQTIANVTGVLCPALASSLFSLSIERNWMGGYLAYCVQLIAVCGAVWVGTLLPSKVWTHE